jgi:hypothetical protein
MRAAASVGIGVVFVHNYDDRRSDDDSEELPPQVVV